jgi:predicted amidophosphoribosyltransferase
MLRPAEPFDPPDHLTSCMAVVEYEGAARQLIAAMKYRNNRAVIGRLGAAAAGLVPAEPAVDVVTWPPTSPSRRRVRGFDQAELLARAVAKHLGVPARRLLRRRDRAAQTASTFEVRLMGPAFEPARPAPRRVVLVDDVVTTGATLSNAAEVLGAAGAERVLGLAIAHTLPPCAQSSRTVAKLDHSR